MSKVTCAQLLVVVAAAVAAAAYLHANCSVKKSERAVGKGSQTRTGGKRHGFVWQQWNKRSTASYSAGDQVVSIPTLLQALLTCDFTVCSA